MPLQPLFRDFRPLIEARFVAAKNDAGSDAAVIEMLIAETPLGNDGRRAEFSVIDPMGPVRVTWNGIASLWAFSQGAARLARRMHDGKRDMRQCLIIDDDPELVRGLDSLELARRLLSQDIPAHAANTKAWPAWAPPIDPSPPFGSDDETGLRFFVGALDWILRHEIAHVALHHADRQASESLSNKQCESEADLAATKWLKGESIAARDRILGEKPQEEELQLEWRAIANGLGLIWVALFESDRYQGSSNYPPVAERFLACLDALELREDSAAAEILSDIMQVWIGPEDQWAPAGGYPTARDAFIDSLVRLHRHLSR